MKKTQRNLAMIAAPRMIRIVLRIRAITTPINRTRCCNSTGTANEAMSTTNTNRLSTLSEYSVM